MRARSCDSRDDSCDDSCDIPCDSRDDSCDDSCDSRDGSIPVKMILLTGRSQSGKSTVARYLVEKHGYKEFALGDGLKRFIVDMYEILHKLDGIDRIALNDLHSDSKEKYRRHMQLIGTDLCRRSLYKHIWCTVLEHELKTYIRSQTGQINIVISDIRFLDEHEYFRDMYINGYNIDISTLSLLRLDTDEMTHESETECDQIIYDYIILNDGSVAYLLSEVDRILGAINGLYAV